MQIVNAKEEQPGWWSVNFRYEAALVEAVKTIPGMRWDKDRRTWRGPTHAIIVLGSVIEACGSKLNTTRFDWSAAINWPALVDTGVNKLRDYQLEGVQKIIANPGFALTMEPRTGKTPTASAALAAIMASGLVSRAIIIYPNGVRGEWETQLPKWSGGLQLRPIQGMKNEGYGAFTAAQWPNYSVLGVHHEILGQRADDLYAFANLGTFMLLVDEGHLFANRKAPRTKALLTLAAHAHCHRRVWITGTPQRNLPKSTWPMFEFLTPSGTGGYWSWAKRYAEAEEREHGWWDKGRSNEPELAERLASISFRVTRAEVAPWLPKAERIIIRADLTGPQRKRYAAQERVLGGKIAGALKSGHFNADQVAALKTLAATTANAKYGVAIERIGMHADGRKVKVLVGAVHHETLIKLAQKLGGHLEAADTALRESDPDADDLDPEENNSNLLPRRLDAPVMAPVFVAGGWLTPDKRKPIIDQWKACPGPAVLLVNIQASGVGIDLADADCAICLELPWVPSDAEQFEARIQDVHLGKRTTPPMYEYILAKNTIDEDVAAALINKMNSISAVVGKTETQDALRASIAQSGVVDRSALSLVNTEIATVEAALDSFRLRLLGDEDPYEADEVTALAANLDETDPGENEEDGE
jgi:hypothetical protein